MQLRILESISSVSYRIIGVILMLIGVIIVILGFINIPTQLQIIVWFIGLGFTSIGLVLLKQDYKENIDEQRFNQLIAKLDEMQQVLKEEPPQNKTSTVVADIITSGLKYYTGQVTKPEENE